MPITISYIILVLILVIVLFFLICLIKTEKNSILSGKYHISPVIDNDVFKLTIFENGFKTKNYYINYCFYDLFYDKPLITISYWKFPLSKNGFITNISINGVKIN